MVEDFPPLQQRPGSKSCLPTAVTAILRYFGRDVTVNQVSQWCQEGPDGCVIDLAMDGLRGQDCDVIELTSNPEEEIRQCVNGIDDLVPVLVTIKPAFSEVMDHAVVVLGIDTDENDIEIITLMDPLTGSIESIPGEEFFLQWDNAGQLAFVIRG